MKLAIGNDHVAVEMKNEIMSAALASMILGFGGFIFAQSQDSSEKNGSILNFV